MKKFRGLSRSTRHAMHSRGETAHEAKMADTFCAGCESNIGQGSLGFPICKEKVTTCTMVPINAIL